ncbi:MAG TPA: DUF1549 domain-containing protein, partial [Gemmatales bacterium]|nr:DUF1549 domain-containing protein [Gemmatales bacterium]
MRSLASCITICLVVLSLLAQEPPKPTKAQFDHFEQQVLPILKASCFKCHGGEGKPKAGLSLITREGILEGGDTEPAVNLKDPAKSLLLKAINHDGLQMPPTGKLTPAKIATITEWVKAGIPWPSHIKIEVKEHHTEGGKVTAESKNYWAYKPVSNPPVPAVKNAGWVKTPIDAFILARLEAKNLSPSPVASKLHLIRRAYYDLIGLPPTPEEIDAFEKDSDPAAYE